MLSVKRFFSCHGIKKRRSFADATVGIIVKSVTMRTAECGLRTGVKCRLRVIMQTADQGLNADCRLIDCVASPFPSLRAYRKQANRGVI